MTLDTFFEKFELLADAPDAVGRMRELILRLAVQGALTTKQEADEPVGELVKELDRCRGKRGGKSRQGRALGSDRSSGERPFSIPDHWTWIQLNRIGSLSGGLTPSKSNPAYWDGDLNWFTSRDIKSDELMESGLKITALAAAENGLQRYRPGCLFMVARSGILRRTFPVSINRVEATSNQDLKVLEPYIEGLERYIQIMLRGMTGFILSSLVKTGTTVESLKYLEFENQQFPLPPLAEQKRIVAKVEELMALCDRLEAQQQERATRHAALARASLARFAEAPTPANLNLLFHPSYDIPPAELRKAILTLAVQGKLVRRIESEGLGSDILPACGIEDDPLDGAPPLPSHWAWAQLGRITTLMNSGWSPACEAVPAASGAWGVLKTTAVQSLQYLEEQNKALPPALAPRPENEVMDGDILFTRAGPMNRVGILCVARPTRKNLMLSDKIIRFHLINGVDPDFAALAMTSGYPSACIEELKSGMAASQVNISQPKLRSVPIPIPPHSEQLRIVAKVEQLMALVDHLEARLTASRDSAGKLLEAVAGELTKNESR